MFGYRGCSVTEDVRLQRMFGSSLAEEVGGSQIISISLEFLGPRSSQVKTMQR